jgi:hypothetical protein
MLLLRRGGRVNLPKESASVGSNPSYLKIAGELKKLYILF